MTNNRWLIAAAAVVMQICLGAAYGWSVFVAPLVAMTGWTLTQVSLNFTLAIAFLGLGTIIGGLWQDRVGPRMVATVAGVIYGAGYLLAGWFAARQSLAGLYVSYGVLGGFGMGMGYITPVATITKWFPDRRGLMTGVAVAGYGAGALIMSPFAARSILARGVPATFEILGVVYLVLVVLAAQFYRNPPQGWRPAGWQPSGAVAAAASTYDFTVGEAMRTGSFWLLWLMLFLNVSAGIMIISQASPMAQQLAHMTPVAAAGMVGLISIFNGAGRVFWAWVSDSIGRARVYLLLYVIQAVIFLMLPRLTNLTLFSAAFAVIGLCYGGGFGTMPSFTADFFGAKYMGGIYGWILLAWGAGAIPSPILIARLRQTTGRYDQAIYAIAVVMLIGIVLPLIVRRPAPPGAVRYEPGSMPPADARRRA
ncbi:MAG: major facilitator superfamily transporter [Acidobacteria bacterium]|nr:major facilitator superfamily transporter [Acidobacteriota bacterium]